MALTPSTMRDLGTQAPQLALPDTAGKIVRTEDFKEAKALLVIFMCNHCPYVIHLRKAFADFANTYQPKGLAIVGINSNDVDNYPADSPEKMHEEKEDAGYAFPYLYDENQAVAKAYHAACTPDFFLFNAEQKLVYRGQWDDSRPKNDLPVTGKDMRAAVEAVLAGEKVSAEQKPSVGCNIKWKPDNAPDYFG